MPSPDERQSSQRPAGLPPAGPAPAGAAPRFATVGGVGVVIVTGAAALAGFGANYVMTPIDWVLAGLVGLLTIAGAIGLVRLIRHHGGEIGEARFDTSHRSDDDRADEGSSGASSPQP